MTNLKAEPDVTYLVYPSRSGLTYRWDDVPDIIRHPLSFPGAPPGFNPIHFGYPDVIQQADLISGPFGGGIIRVHAVAPAKWLPAIILMSQANAETPIGLLRMGSRFPAHVRQIVPQGFGIRRESFAECPSFAVRNEVDEHLYIASTIRGPADYEHFHVAITDALNRLCLHVIDTAVPTVVEMLLPKKIRGMGRRLVFVKVGAPEMGCGEVFARMFYCGLYCADVFRSCTVSCFLVVKWS